MLFQPGDTKTVNLVHIDGNQAIRGGNGIADGHVHDANIKAVMEAVLSRGLGHLEETNASFTKLDQLVLLPFASDIYSLKSDSFILYAGL